MTKISVITPTFNAEQTIEKTIKSVLNQDYDIFEYLIIDSNSNDRTVDIAKNFSYPITIISEKDKGIFDAMNKGIKCASGDLIFIINAGDYYEENIFSELINIYKTYNPDLIAASCKMIDACIETKWTRSENPLNEFNPAIKHPSIFVKKKVYKEIGQFNLDFPISADYEFIVRAMSKNKKIYSTNLVTTNILLEGNSFNLKNHFSKNLEHLKIINRTDFIFLKKILFFLKVFNKTLIGFLSLMKRKFR